MVQNGKNVYMMLKYAAVEKYKKKINTNFQAKINVEKKKIIHINYFLYIGNVKLVSYFFPWLYFTKI